MDPLPRCARHPDQPAQDVCARCGIFVCALDRAELDGGVYCSTCVGLPEVDYLEAFRQQCWGRRDTWAWTLGVAGLLELAAGTALLVNGHLVGLLGVIAGIVGGAFWIGVPRAREALVGVGVLGLGLGLAQGGLQGLIAAALPFAVLLAAYQDPRSQLYFRLEVPRDRLLWAWRVHANNRVAHAGFALSIFGLCLWPVAPLALGLSLVGLRRVDPTARPPIGRRGQAWAGIVLGAVGCAIGLAMLVRWRWG